MMKKSLFRKITGQWTGFDNFTYDNMVLINNNDYLFHLEQRVSKDSGLISLQSRQLPVIKSK